MSEHSPGPWRWENWAEANSTVRLRAADGDSVLRIHDDVHSRYPSKVDGRLIAAAPELAASLALLATGVQMDAPRAALVEQAALCVALLRRIEGDT